MYQYLMAVDRTFNTRLSLGTLMCGMNIQAAIEAGFTEYDFLKGEEPYKLALMNAGRRAMNVTLHNRTLPAVSAWSLRTANGLRKILHGGRVIA
jgi:CelD/BcsL family acetyltransferase involved in cellulose biosynthesis